MARVRDCPHFAGEGNEVGTQRHSHGAGECRAGPSALATLRCQGCHGRCQAWLDGGWTNRSPKLHTLVVNVPRISRDQLARKLPFCHAYSDHSASGSPTNALYRGDAQPTQWPGLHPHMVSEPPTDLRAQHRLGRMSPWGQVREVQKVRGFLVSS